MSNMYHVPVYICNRKKCLVCKGAICGRTIDKDYAELDENGEPIIAEYYDDGEIKLEEVAK